MLLILHLAYSEPSAALDPRAEAELFERIHSLSGSNASGRRTTTIYISHRFSTGMRSLDVESDPSLTTFIVRRADKIAVVDKVRTVVWEGFFALLILLKHQNRLLSNSEPMKSSWQKEARMPSSSTCKKVNLNRRSRVVHQGCM